MILITGATGLLGSHLLYSLIASGEKVRATMRSTSNLQEVKRVFSYYTDDYEKLFDRVEWVEADLSYPESFESIFEDVDRVYHAAAFVSFDPRDRSRLVNDNRKITANIVNECLEKANIRLLHVSSTAALGAAPEGECVDESTMWKPDKMNTGYSISKFLSEMEVWRGIEEGLDAVIVNPSVIFGAGFWEKGSSSMFTNIQKGLKYYTNGVTGFVGVEDVVKCMVWLMNSDVSNERYIISAENLSYREVFTMIAEELGKKPPHIEATPFLSGLAWRLDAFRSWFGPARVITHETVRAGNNKTYFSNAKIKTLTDIKFEPVKEVIKRVVDKKTQSTP